MSADLLREAAALMRSRADLAEASWPSPWTYSKRESEVHHSGPGPWGYDRPYVSSADGWHADEHIASWHPAVALAVADWLDAQAERVEAGFCGKVGSQAIAVATAYLGRTS